ncbi:hypothetical protein Fifi067_00051 [Erwinia phage Fifi067]|nr:hypothetical protein Fifi067_00051 [Erwinia phage Fifi067]WBQ32503.1 hypothetical protein [Erwinia phage Kuerle]
MANAEVTQVTVFRLVVDLSPNELDALKALVQNPLHRPQDESPSQRNMREAIFNACNKHRT